MQKDEMKDLLLEMLNEKDGLFSDVTSDDSQDAIMVKSVNGKSYVLTMEQVEDREEFIRQWARENPVSLSMEFVLLYLLEEGIIPLEDVRGYMTEITKRADELEEKYSGAWFW